MKNILLIPVLALALVACNFASDEDYANLAQDTCDCLNQSTQGLSERARQLFIDAGGDVAQIEKGFKEYTEADPLAAMADAKVIQSLEESELKECLASVETKYDHLYSSESQDVIIEKILKYLDESDDCKFSASVMRAGLALQ